MADIKSNDTYFCGHSKDEDTFDYIMLKTFVVLAIMANIITNSVVIWRIYSSKKQTRANVMFSFLSVSDLFIAFLSFPMFCLTLFHLSDLPIHIKDCNLNLYIMYLPTYCSWYLTVLIAIDRLLVIKYNKKYENFISKKVLVRSVLFGLTVYIGTTLVFFFNRDSMATAIVASIFQLVLTGTVFITYIYILWLTRRKLNLFQNNTSHRQQAVNRLTWTIFYIFLCQVIFALPGPIVNFVYTEHWGDAGLERKLRYWARVLFFSNSFINGWILLRSQLGIKKTEDVKREVCRTTSTKKSFFIISEDTECGRLSDVINLENSTPKHVQGKQRNIKITCMVV